MRWRSHTNSIQLLTSPTPTAEEKQLQCIPSSNQSAVVGESKAIYLSERGETTKNTKTSLQPNQGNTETDRIHKLDSDNSPSDLWMSTLSPTTIWLGMAVGMITDLSSIGVQKSLWSKKFFWLPKNWINEKYRKQVLKEFKSVAKYSAGFICETFIFLID